MLKLAKEGSYPISITLMTLTQSTTSQPPENKPTACVKKNKSQYKTTLKWKMNSETNIYHFTVQGESLKLDIDLQGNVINREYDIWAMLCPLDILFTQRIKIGQFQCSHFYTKYNTEDNQEQE